MKQSLSAFYLSLALAIPAAAGGVHILSVHESLTEKKEPMMVNLWIEKDKVRMEGMGEGYMIYRADKKLFWMVNEKEKSYTEMTEKDLEQLAGKMDEAMKKLNEQMAKMPPEQREMMEKMMKGMKGAQGNAAGAKTTYKKIGSDKVNGWDCDNYEGTQDGLKRTEMCISTSKKTDISEADVQVLKDMAAMFSKMMKSVSQFMPDPKETTLPKGLPVRTIAYHDGKATSRSEVKEIKKESIPAAKFDVPAGLAKKNLGNGPRGESGF